MRFLPYIFRFATFFSVAVCLSVVAGLSATPTQSTNWSRDFLDDLPEDVRFALAAVMSIEGQLVGYFVFNNGSGSAVILDGARTPDREFWPSVTPQVADGIDGPWTTCSEWKNPGVAATLEVESAVTAKLMVDLSVFRSQVDTTNYGRILLNNGEAAVFKLEQLRASKR